MVYNPSGREEAEFLQNYDASEYQNPAVAADVALFAADAEQLKILLIKRGGYPYKDCWALPGGFVNIDEDLPDSARRELLEETGIAVPYIEQAAVWGKPERDPRQRVITVSFVGLVDIDTAKAKAGDDAAAAEWFAIADYTKTVRERSTYIEFSLDGAQKISAQVSFPNNRIQEIMCEKSGGLAFDHAESIAVSVEFLKQRVQTFAQRSLTKEKAALAAELIQNI